MDFMELEKLATILKGNESQIKNGKTTVSLTVHVLEKINHLINTHIKSQMINNPNIINSIDPIETVRNLEIIYRLLQSTVNFKLIKDVIHVEDPVDLAELRSLKQLEIYKVDILKITGLQLLRLHLEKLICSRSLETLVSLLEYCGGDYSSKYVWNELKELILPYNKLQSLDSSLDCVPWLRSLDISHNELTSVDEVSCLGNLKYLNISFNYLQKLPKFSGQICNRLQILNASNNFIEDISELQPLVNIYELDLSQNCLLDHQVLCYISLMAALQYLNLKENPLYFHANHKKRTCACLHRYIDPKRFVLDGLPLSKSDIKCIGPMHLLQRPIAGLSSDLNNSGELSMSQSSVGGRPRTVRHVLSDEPSEEIDEEPFIPNSCSSIDHLKIKQTIQDLRQEYGDKWLNYYYETNDATPIERFLTPEIANITDKSHETYKSVNLDSVEKSTDEAASNIVETTDLTLVDADANEQEYRSNSDEGIYNSVNEDSSSTNSDDIDISGEENIFFAKISGEEDEILLVLNKDLISERDSTTSKELNQFFMNTLIKCEYLNDEKTEVKLTFDTLRKDRQQQIYELDAKSAEQLTASLNAIINNRKASNKIFKCMKCLTQFSKSALAYDETVACPSCKSTIIVEDYITENNVNQILSK